MLNVSFSAGRGCGAAGKTWRTFKGLDSAVIEEREPGVAPEAARQLSFAVSFGDQDFSR